MYMPDINDEKRDYVEYTSDAFMSHKHTMVTYTRASDSILCVPLMIDAAVWCSFFAKKKWDFKLTCKALAYLFKVPEGAAKGVDPGFFNQMSVLKGEISAATGLQYLSGSPDAGSRRGNNLSDRKAVRIKESIFAKGSKSNPSYAVPDDKSVICAGLACIDMQLEAATRNSNNCESIESFAGNKIIGGGSVCMSTRTLARLCFGEKVRTVFEAYKSPPHPYF